MRFLLTNSLVLQLPSKRNFWVSANFLAIGLAYTLGPRCSTAVIGVGAAAATTGVGSGGGATGAGAGAAAAAGFGAAAGADAPKKHNFNITFKLWIL